MTQKTKTIRLTRPHEHGGRLWPVDTELTLPADSAAWVISHGKAVDVVTPAKTRRGEKK